MQESEGVYGSSVFTNTSHSLVWPQIQTLQSSSDRHLKIKVKRSSVTWPRRGHDQVNIHFWVTLLRSQKWLKPWSVTSFFRNVNVIYFCLIIFFYYYLEFWGHFMQYLCNFYEVFFLYRSHFCCYFIFSTF